jgi:hypothetical protein
MPRVDRIRARERHGSGVEQAQAPVEQIEVVEQNVVVGRHRGGLLQLASRARPVAVGIRDPSM